MEKMMFFVIPEMPSKTFVMVLKKLPGHFKLHIVNAVQRSTIGELPSGFILLKFYLEKE